MRVDSTIVAGKHYSQFTEAVVDTGTSLLIVGPDAFQAFTSQFPSLS